LKDVDQGRQRPTSLTDVDDSKAPCDEKQVVRWPLHMGPDEFMGQLAAGLDDPSLLEISLRRTKSCNFPTASMNLPLA